jgi:hypothetical protein
VRFEAEGEPIQLALHASVFRMRDREHTLVSLYDIGGRSKKRKWKRGRISSASSPMKS